MPKIWKKLSSKVVHEDPWVIIHLDKVIKPNGKAGTYAWMQTQSDGVQAIALTNKREVYLVKQFRYPTKSYSWEFPGGGTNGENPLVAVKRELWEETGMVAKKWKKIGKIDSFNSFSNDKLGIFLATGLSQTSGNKKHEDGILEVKKVSLKTAIKMVAKGQITDTQTISGLYFLMLKNKKIKI